MSRLKYVTAEILNEVLPYIRRALKEGKDLHLTDEEIDYLKQEILDRCPSSLKLNKCPIEELREDFVEFTPGEKFEAFRVIVEYEGTLRKAFYPQLIINESERKLVINRYLISQYLASLDLELLSLSRDEILESLIAGICSLLSVSLFTRLEGAKWLAARMRSRGKKVIGIRKGFLSSMEGKYFGKNPEVKVNWYPYSEIDEWSFFSEILEP